MGRFRQAPIRVVAAAAVAACAAAIAGCGGGGDDNGSSTSAARIPTVTAPGSGQSSPQGNDSTSTTETTPGNPPGPGNLPQGAAVQQALTPFRDCLSQHGVSPESLYGRQGAQQRDPEELRAQIEKAFVCIPELPPQLRASAERFKRRFEQQDG